MQKTLVWSLCWDDPLQKEMGTYSSILAWEIPGTEDPNRLQSIGSQRVRRDLATKQQALVLVVFTLKVFLPVISICLSDSSAFASMYRCLLFSPPSPLPTPSSVQFISVQLFATPWTAAQQASLSVTNYRGLLKLMSIESAMPSNHLILCLPLFFLPSIFPSIFSNEPVLRIRWPKYWSFSFSTSTSNEYSGLISSRIDWFDLLSVQGTLKRLL